MKIFCVITIARMCEGEFIFIRTEGAFKQASKADELLKKLKQSFVDIEGKVKLVKLSTSQGEAICQCEAGVFELELEE